MKIENTTEYDDLLDVDDSIVHDVPDECKHDDSVSTLTKVLSLYKWMIFNPEQDLEIDEQRLNHLMAVTKQQRMKSSRPMKRSIYLRIVFITSIAALILFSVITLWKTSVDEKISICYINTITHNTLPSMTFRGTGGGIVSKKNLDQSIIEVLSDKYSLHCMKEPGKFTITKKTVVLPYKITEKYAILLSDNLINDDLQLRVTLYDTYNKKIIGYKQLPWDKCDTKILKKTVNELINLIKTEGDDKQ